MPRKCPRSLIDTLRKELPLWQQDGLISQEQADLIIKRYDLNPADERQSPSRFIAAISVIGALLLGSGIILLIASNWQSIPRLFKLLLLSTSIIAVDHAGFHLKYVKQSYPRTGAALIFLGSLLFGAGIWLVAQIYNISSRYDNGTLYWALGIIPVAWLLGMETVLTLASALLSLWGVWKACDFHEPNYLYPVLVGALVIPLAYKTRSRAALLVSMAGVCIWFGTGPMAYYIEKSSLMMAFPYMVLGALFYATGLCHSLHPRAALFEPVYTLFGGLLMFGSVYIISFHEMAKDLAETLAKPIPSALWLVSGGMGILCIAAAIFALRRARSHKLGQAVSSESAFLLGCLFLGTFLFLGANEFVSTGILSNIMLFWLAMSLVYFGYKRGEPFMVNLGFLLFAVHFITRYTDLGWKYLPRSAFFISAGALLLVWALVLERKRKKLVAAARRVHE